MALVAFPVFLPLSGLYGHQFDRLIQTFALTDIENEKLWMLDGTN